MEASSEKIEIPPQNPGSFSAYWGRLGREAPRNTAFELYTRELGDYREHLLANADVEIELAPVSLEPEKAPEITADAV